VSVRGILASMETARGAGAVVVCAIADETLGR
jgi:hypothetical protein